MGKKIAKIECAGGGKPTTQNKQTNKKQKQKTCKSELQYSQTILERKLITQGVKGRRDSQCALFNTHHY